MHGDGAPGWEVTEAPSQNTWRGRIPSSSSTAVAAEATGTASLRGLVVADMVSDRFIPGGGSDGVRRGRGGSSRAGVSRVDRNNGTIEGTKGYKILADLENGRAEKNEGRPAHRGQQRPPRQVGTFLSAIVVQLCGRLRRSARLPTRPHRRRRIRLGRCGRAPRRRRRNGSCEEGRRRWPRRQRGREVR